jgi:tRNA 2-thiouridine synthesizing protein A
MIVGHRPGLDVRHAGAHEPRSTLPTQPLTPLAQAELDALFADVDRLEGTPCTGCGRVLCGHACVIAIQMGSREAPLCPGCLAEILGSPLEPFLERAVSFLERRDCYRTAWLRASAREGQVAPMRPACLWSMVRGEEAPAAREPDAGDPSGNAELRVDLGDEGCGDLALALRRHAAAVPPGTVILVRATDPGATHDIPAWCRLAGHTLLEAEHPTYRLRTRP